MKRMALVVAATILSGCMHHNAKIYQPIVQNEKTVTVPPGNKGLKGEIKKALADNGWTLLIDKGETTTEGTIEKSIAMKQSPEYGTRYRIYLSSHQYDWCLSGSPAIVYEISLIDNKTSSEVFTQDGSGCESHAIEKFANLLHGKTESEPIEMKVTNQSDPSRVGDISVPDYVFAR